MEYTVEMKVTVPDDQSHVMLNFPDIVQDALVGTNISVSRMLVTNDTLQKELAP